MKPSWLIGSVLKKCGVPCAYEIGMMLAKESDEPVIPDVPDVPDVPIPTAIYTLANVEGKAVTKRTYNGAGSAVKTHTNYATGQFPLSITAKMTDTSAVTHNSLSLPEVHLHPIAHAGDFIEVSFNFPSIIVDCESYSFDYQWCLMYGTANSGEDAPWVQCGCHRYGSSCSNSGALMDSDFLGEVIKDTGGNVIGVKFSGTLLHDVDYIKLNCSVRSDSGESIQPYNGDVITTFGSYDDFVMKVYENEVN